MTDTPAFRRIRRILREELTRLGFGATVEERLWADIEAQSRRGTTHPHRVTNAIFRARKTFPLRAPQAVAPPKRRLTVAAHLVFSALRRLGEPCALSDAELVEYVLKQDLPVAWTREGSESEQQTAWAGPGTGLFRCAHCGTNHTTHYEQQTRGADEAMTIFVCCHACGRTWTV